MSTALPPSSKPAETRDDCRVSVVIPVHDEAASIPPLAEKLLVALEAWRPFEVIFVDDGSGDDSPAALRALGIHPEIRALRHKSSVGQSGALRSGVLAARAPVIVTLDGDGQNDPADIPSLLDALATSDRIGLVQGERTGRQAGLEKKLTSRLANRLRQAVLRDGARDSGCALRAFPRETYLALPYFDHLHRFMPALVKREGFDVIYLPVRDHPRQAGRSHYGTLDRLFSGVADLFGVWWLLRRRKLPETKEIDR